MSQCLDCLQLLLKILKRILILNVVDLQKLSDAPNTSRRIGGIIIDTKMNGVMEDLTVKQFAKLWDVKARG